MTKGERGWKRWSSRRDRAVIKIERYIDDFSDALPRRRSPLLSLERVAGDPRSKARTAEDRKKGPAIERRDHPASRPASARIFFYQRVRLLGSGSV